MRDLVADGQLVLLGVVQEQHAERCQLYAKWKELDWPILHDPINMLGCSGVPITIAIDELGVVRSTNPTPEWTRDTFLNAPTQPNIVTVSDAKRPDIAALETRAQQENSVVAWRDLGDAIMLWRPTAPTLAVHAYRKALDTLDKGLDKATLPELHFRMGVALRHRSESAQRQPDDFASAVVHWSAALDGNPNQYIWRRRIQQYGPRLDKPYPFYDWVDEAIAQLASRDRAFEGFRLHVPLSGAEIAKPMKQRESNQEDSGTVESPDPRNLITRDQGELVRISKTLVPSSNRKQASFQLHLELHLTGLAAWNNEAQPVQVWFQDVQGLLPSARLIVHRPEITSAESDEIRIMDTEFQLEKAISTTIRGFVLYYICEKSTNQCILRRQDFAVPIRID